MLFSRDPRSRRRAELLGAAANLLLGAVCLMCGLSKTLVFLGSSASWPFTAIGAFLVVVGGLRVARWLKGRNAAAPKEEPDGADGDG